MASADDTTGGARAALCTAGEPRAAGWTFLSEVVGTCGLLLAAVSAVWATAPGAALAPVDDALPHGRLLVVGIAVGGAIWLFSVTPLARCSGAHLNPAISLMLRIRGELTGRELATYVVAQFAGSFLGVAAGRLLWGRDVAAPDTAFALIQPGPGWGAGATAAGEFGMTALLLAAVLTTRSRGWGPLRACALITGMIWVGGAWNGGGFNPARTLAPAAFSGDWHLQLVYLLAPLVAGAALAVPRAVVDQGLLLLTPPRRRSSPVAKPD